MGQCDHDPANVCELKRSGGRTERRCKGCYARRAKESRERTKDARTARARARAAAVDRGAEMPLCPCGNGKRSMPSTVRTPGGSGSCSECHYRRMQRYWATPEGQQMRRESANRTREKLRRELLDAYGGMCTCCGEDIAPFLTIDHIDGNGGGRNRKETGPRLWARLRREGWPTDNYRLLCFNCNTGRHINGGICPHEENE